MYSKKAEGEPHGRYLTLPHILEHQCQEVNAPERNEKHIRTCSIGRALLLFQHHPMIGVILVLSLLSFTMSCHAQQESLLAIDGSSPQIGENIIPGDEQGKTSRGATNTPVFIPVIICMADKDRDMLVAQKLQRSKVSQLKMISPRAFGLFDNAAYRAYYTALWYTYAVPADLQDVVSIYRHAFVIEFHTPLLA